MFTCANALLYKCTHTYMYVMLIHTCIHVRVYILCTVGMFLHTCNVHTCTCILCTVSMCLTYKYIHVHAMYSMLPVFVPKHFN